MDKKKLIYILSGIMGGIILLIVVISIILGVSNKKTSYENMEQIMANAAYEYYQNNLSKLPNESIRTSVVDENTLVNEKFMKPIKKYTKDESCKGNVVVTYNNNDYDDERITSMRINDIREFWNNLNLLRKYYYIVNNSKDTAMYIAWADKDNKENYIQYSDKELEEYFKDIDMSIEDAKRIVGE